LEQVQVKTNEGYARTTAKASQHTTVDKVKVREKWNKQTQKLKFKKKMNLKTQS